MARPWYTRDPFRKAAGTIGTFLGVLLMIFLLGHVPAIGAVYQRIEGGFVRVGTGFGNTLERLTEREGSLQAQYNQCAEDRRFLAQDQAERQALLREVEELRQQVNYMAQTGTVGVTSHIIARAIDNDATRVVVDRGEVDGVVSGSAVIIGEGIYYGQVEDVRTSTAVVRLAANTESHIPAAILGKQRTIGLVEGKEGALLAMEFVPQDAQLQEGDVVVTSGLESTIREGLVIGLVTEVIVVESAPFQRALIELLYEPREWTTVLIVPPPSV